MATYIALLHYTDQGIRNVKDTVKRAAAAKDVAAKMGVKLTELFWTLGQYDLALIAEAPDEETMTEAPEDQTGELPLATSGGQLSAGRLHSFGHLYEACLQLRGEAGERQVPDTKVVAVSAGAGPLASCLLLRT